MVSVSVVMASYNHEKYVGRAVQSVLEQSHQDFELVITDDGSDDGTAAEIARFADPRIKFFRFPRNRGQFVALNHCLRAAGGEYIAVLNSDDAFLPGKLECQVKFLESHPEVGAVFSRVRVVDAQDRVLRRRKTFLAANMSRYEWLNRFFYKDNRLCHPSAMVRRQCHETVGLYDQRYAQLADYDFWIRLCMKYEIHILPDELVAFRWLPHEANMSGRRPDSIMRRWWEYRHILDDFLALDDSAFFRRVFPEAEKYGGALDEVSMPFVLALLALEAKTRRQIHQAFALDTIHRLLGNAQTAERLLQHFGFDYRDFVRLTGAHDVFNVVTVRRMRMQDQKGQAGLWRTALARLRKWRRE